jgi:predicted KAP-like P-loop ATPase
MMCAMSMIGWIKEKYNSAFRNGSVPISTAVLNTSATPEVLKNSKGVYLSDAPIVDVDEDKFDRSEFAKRIAATIGSKIDPSSIVIGLYGPWGDGKTTVLNFVQNELNRFDSVICFKFNPWRFEDESVLLNSFFETLAAVLQRKLSTHREEIGKTLSRYGGVLSSAGKALKSTLDLAGMGIHTPPVGDLGDAAANLGAVLSGTSLEELRKRIDDILVAEAKRVVIVMDDIDRLEKSEIHAVLRLIKLTADFQFTAYILAFDHSMVASAIGDRYSGNPGGTFQAGMSFLEKIIQVPIHLPPVTESALLVYCYECIENSLREAKIELTAEEAQTFGTLFQRSLARNVTTPRMAKRYANALTFSLVLLQGEVHLGELMLIEGLRVFLPKCFESIRDNKNLLLQPGRTLANLKSEPDIAETLVTSALAAATNENRNRITELIRVLFPRTTGVNYNQEWDAKWSKEKRIAAKDYFDRYFSLSITHPMSQILKLERCLIALMGCRMRKRSANSMAYLHVKMWQP